MKLNRLKTIFLGASVLLMAVQCENESETPTPEQEQEEQKQEETETETSEGRSQTCDDSIYKQATDEAQKTMDLTGWEVVWEDDFDYPDAQLDDNWESQNGASGGEVLSSRWRENAVVKDGVLELLAKKESRGGQDWTAGNIWTRDLFGYGYFECKYKYAGAKGTNNSFWLYPRYSPSSQVNCELDVNEGHFPNEINTNRHHWLNGTTENAQLPYTEGIQPYYGHSLEQTVTTTKIRFSSNNASHFHIREFRIYEANEDCYPANVLSSSADTELTGLNNLAKDPEVSITASGVYRDEFKVSQVADGSVSTSWVSQATGKKWLEFSWPEAQEVGHVQFVNGWQSGSEWLALISDYKIEAWVDDAWVTLVDFDVVDTHNYAEEYHVYGMDWNEDKIDFYFDNQLIRTIDNTQCNNELNIYLSLAILEYAGEVTDAIDGTSMKVDWVKYYQKK
ncbi:family 16 glycosylhydrolase [Reichenbachiella carrageenanivorans]|uniref:Family 16 glycosylhydrolase n=1 Tax=Reichenbachiella carrageenanivorans TaxID=2979869 RepID=A0ABY6CYL4_9BACT|nr:family 16 glycosylhydrolase [Reichenbachiella carrageenanivorans]UXX77868.1 family 16 glycosylhydrolase [Reichenbachiella carrageenanivorans]